MMNEFKKIMWEQLEFRLGKKLVDPNKAMSKILVVGQRAI
jgi:hypothetical protein